MDGQMDREQKEGREGEEGKWGGKEDQGREGRKEGNRHTTEMTQSITDLSPNSIVP